jgi:hypothetical protein
MRLSWQLPKKMLDSATLLLCHEDMSEDHGHFYQHLAGMDPEEVCRRAACSYNRERQCFLIDAWSGRYEVFPVRSEILPFKQQGGVFNLWIELTLLFYLVGAKEIFVKNEWVSEKDIPTGEAFFRGPHTVPTHLLAERFGNDLEGFSNRCHELGGEPVDMADAAFEFRILPRVPVAVLLWKSDEEFGAESRLLFDRTISEHLPLDIIFSLTVELCQRISGSSL